MLRSLGTSSWRQVVMTSVKMPTSDQLSTAAATKSSDRDASEPMRRASDLTRRLLEASNRRPRTAGYQLGEGMDRHAIHGNAPASAQGGEQRLRQSDSSLPYQSYPSH